jgi:hypothetical protein
MMKKITTFLFALALVAPVFSQPVQKNNPALQPSAEKTTLAPVLSKDPKLPEISCYEDRETGRLVCPGAIAAYRSLYDKGCCHYDIRTNTAYCH